MLRRDTWVPPYRAGALTPSPTHSIRPATNLRQNHNNSPPNFVHLSKIWKFRRKRLRMVFEGAIFDPYIVNILYTDTHGCLALPPSAVKQIAYLRNLILHGRVLK